MAKFGHFASGQGNLLQEKFSSVHHHILALGEILLREGEKQRMVMYLSARQLLEENRSTIFTEKKVLYLTHWMLQRCEADEPKEELSSRGHSHRGIGLLQPADGFGQVLSQAQDGLTYRSPNVIYRNTHHQSVM